MDLHEYQAKELLARFGVPVPAGAVATTEEEARQAAEELGGGRWVVKAQIHAGGRGKAGGILTAATHDEVAQAAGRLLGSKLVTLQTGPGGKPVSRVYIERAVDIARELYAAFVLDRAAERVCAMASASGGTEVEDRAHDDPTALRKEVVEPAVGLQAFQARELAFSLGLRGAQTRTATQTLLGAYRAFRALDATLIEFNPLAVTATGDLIVLDAKMSIDDNALFRQPAIRDLRDATQEDPRESEAVRHGLSYIGLDGSIGCIVNGAGLAMATMDLIKHTGGEPANFLDIGGGASPERVATAFTLVVSDPQVRAVLVNIFAGINRCDWVARGIVDAARKVGLHVPLVVRLAGTHVEEGRRILQESGIAVEVAGELAEAAGLVVRAAGVAAP